MRGHYQDNGLGNRELVPFVPDPDEAYERMRDEIEIQNALDRAMKKTVTEAIVDRVMERMA